MTETEAFVERYAAALREHVDHPSEASLGTAYELGRTAVGRRLTVLDLAVAHHEALAAALAGSSPSEWQAAVAAARDFFVESLSTFEMVQRGFREAHEAALLEQRHAAILRQLSNFLADASLALDAAASFEEMLQLIVEQARELVGARRCSGEVVIDDGERRTITAVSQDDDVAAQASDALTATLVAWDGRELGSIRAFDKANGSFTEADAEVLVHLAQMASAAIERAQLYRSKA